MTDFALQKNVDALITQRIASVFATATAGGAGNNTQVTGITIQRSLIGMPMNAAPTIYYETTLSAGKTLSFTSVLVEHSPDGSSWSTLQTLTAPGVVQTGALTNQTGQVSFNVDLTAANDYVRFDFTPSLSNTATDTVTAVAEMSFAGADRLPAAA